MTKTMWCHSLHAQFSCHCPDQLVNSLPSYPGTTMTSKERVCSSLAPLPLLLCLLGCLPGLQSSQALLGQWNHSVFEPLALTDMEFPDATYLHNICLFQGGQVCSANPCMQERHNDGSLK